MKLLIERVLILLACLVGIYFGAGYIWHLYSGMPAGSLYMLP